ncbi:two component sensor histidine kinase [hydrocarbon metagenome]|uniref:histidine kinase n=1 Tax=hydrocarbon metagenome TaxID=938273 RepID=A0A0W8E207_9ZZZZ
MSYDESSIIDENLGTDEFSMLDGVLLDVITTLEKGRDDIFDIAEESGKQARRIEVELNDVKLETSRIIDEVQKQEKNERFARLRLMEVSQNFRSYSETDIQKAYETAREYQLKLMDLRQTEMHLRRRRDELSRQLKKFQAINQKADKFMNTTGMALKILQGNLERISDTLEDAVKSKQVGLWILQSQEAERRKIARELHDGPAQTMASMLIRLDFVQRLWDNDISRINEELDNIKKMSRESLDDIRRIMFDLKPALIHEEEFYYTVRDYLRDFQIKYNFEINFVMFGEKKKYDIAMESAIFRLVQEAINNVRKHAGVNKAMVKLEDNGRNLTLIVKDEGSGFNPGQLDPDKESYGIIGMKERVQLLGGEMEINSRPGEGTQIIIIVPLEGEAKNG